MISMILIEDLAYDSVRRCFGTTSYEKILLTGQASLIPDPM